jgi:hypothetical protein
MLSFSSQFAISCTAARPLTHSSGEHIRLTGSSHFRLSWSALPLRDVPLFVERCFVLIASRLMRAIRNLEHKLPGSFRLVWVTGRWRQRIAVTLFD